LFFLQFFIVSQMPECLVAALTFLLGERLWLQ